VTVGITHNLNPGDTVRIIGKKQTAKVKELNPMQHWLNCVVLDAPLGGWTNWDAHELEKVNEVPERRR
jgi:hypothetical protein